MINIINTIQQLFAPPKKRQELDKLMQDLMKERELDLRKLKNVNRTFRLLLDQGEVELIIRNVRGVIKEGSR